MLDATRVGWQRPRAWLLWHSPRSRSLSPAAVVAAAAAAGVTLLALTDHDTVDGIDEALTAAREHEIRLVPAVELSTVDVLGEDFHVLGYGIDHHDERLAERLEAERRAGEQQAADPAEAERLELERLQAEIDELERVEKRGQAETE